MSAEHHDIFLRAHTVQLEKKQRPNTRGVDAPKWPDYALVFDCESRITADQTLTFGFWRFCCHLINGEYVPLEEGIFHDDEGLSPTELDVLRRYARTTKAYLFPVPLS